MAAKSERVREEQEEALSEPMEKQYLFIVSTQQMHINGVVMMGPLWLFQARIGQYNALHAVAFSLMLK